VIDDEDLVLDPCSFLPGASGPTWTDINNCVWEGPENLLDKKVLAVVPQYCNNQKVARLFRLILDIQNANWEDYMRVLSTLKQNSGPSQEVVAKTSGLYRLLSEVTDGRDRDAIWLVKDFSICQVAPNQNRAVVHLNKNL
jgi:hypothetical protein